MAKAKITDLRKAYPQLAPDKDYPPLRFKSLKGKVSAAEWEARVDCACAYRLERACRAQLLAQSANDEMLLPPIQVVEKTARLYQPGVRRTMGLLEWPAMRRLADRLDPSYKN